MTYLQKFRSRTLPTWTYTYTLREGFKKNIFFIHISWISALPPPPCPIHVGGFYNDTINFNYYPHWLTPLPHVSTFRFFVVEIFVLKVYKSPSTSADEAPYYSTIYPNSRTPSSLAWVQRTQAGLRPNPHVSWTSATTILQCAASLAAGGYDRPCGPI